MAGDFKPAAVSEDLLREHSEGWAGFTRFMLIGAIAVGIVLFAFLLQFGTGWGFAMFAMVLGFIVLGITALIGWL